MAYEEGVNMTMPMQPALYSNGMGDMNNGWWIILLILCLGNGMWGGFGGNGNAGGLYPWLNQSDQMNSGFQNQMLQTSISQIISSISGGFSDVQTALCSGFAGVTAAVTAAQNTLSQQMYTNEIANLERSFAAQTAQTAAMTGIQSQLNQCCCDQKAGIADLKYTIAQEACADRAAVSDAMQRILDTMCQDKIDAKNERIADLERQVTMANLAASQNAQTAEILAALRNQGCGCNPCCGNF